MKNPFDRLKVIQTHNRQNEQIRQSAKHAAVVAIIIQEPDQETKIVLIKRNDYDGHHSAQMAFPGGKRDETDLNLRHTAIREVAEEIGIQLVEEDLTELEPYWIEVSNFWIQPYYIIINKNLSYQVNKREISRIFEIPVAFFKHPDAMDFHELQYMNEAVIAPRFYYESEEIWGATAIMLYQLIQLLD